MFDYVVVGAGSAGCALAARLSEDPRTRVLLLEAGPPDKKLEVHVPAAWTKLFKSEVDWDYQTEPQAALGERSLYLPRGKMLGGTSSLNAQMYLRGHPADYDGWAAMGNAGWGWADVLPYLKRSEDNQRGPSAWHGSGGPLRVADLRDPNPLSEALVAAGVEAGLARNPDFNGPSLDGIGVVQVTQRRGRRHRSADAYLRPARRRGNLTVVTGAHATRVVFEGRRAVGVAYARGGREEVAGAAREVVVSGGTINSPQLLLLSGVGPAAQLRRHGIAVVRDLPGVGRNLHDHLTVPTLATVRRPLSLLSAESKRNLLRFLALRRGMLTSNVIEGAAFTRTRPELPAPDLELMFGPGMYLDEGLTPATEHGVTIAPVVLQPRSRGSVSLRSADPFDAPVIQPNALSDPDGHDLRVLVEGVKLARRMLRAPALRPLVAEEVAPRPDVEGDERLRAFVRERSQGACHPVGTCRMGVDELAVVDPELRVRGVEGLRVADASVIPAIVRGHTHAPAVMIAEKAADRIRGRATVAARGAHAS
jgi:choline dehydrogenase